MGSETVRVFTWRGLNLIPGFLTENTDALLGTCLPLHVFIWSEGFPVLCREFNFELWHFMLLTRDKTLDLGADLWGNTESNIKQLLTVKRSITVGYQPYQQGVMEQLLWLGLNLMPGVGPHAETRTQKLLCGNVCGKISLKECCKVNKDNLSCSVMFHLGMHIFCHWLRIHLTFEKQENDSSILTLTLIVMILVKPLWNLEYNLLSSTQIILCYSCLYMTTTSHESCSGSSETEEGLSCRGSVWKGGGGGGMTSFTKERRAFLPSPWSRDMWTFLHTMTGLGGREGLRCR